MGDTKIYVKTPKGRARLRSDDDGLPRAKAAILERIDGRQSLAELTGSLSPLDRANFLVAVHEFESQGLIRLPNDNEIEFELPIPAVEVTELGPQESVQAWAEANRGSRELEERGFYTVPARLNHAAFVDHNRLHVLVVDDDEMLVKVLTLLLEEHGYLVTSALDAMTAVAELKREDLPDLVLLDVMLGDYSGFDILRAIRKDQRLAKLPVIMITALIGGEHVIKGLKFGADGYIFKPLKWEALYECIQAVTGHR